MSNFERIEKNKSQGSINYDPLQFVISNCVLTKYMGKDTVVHIPDGVKQISATAFVGATEVIDIYIPDSVQAIDLYAFISCASLKTVHIGFGVSVIPMGCFAELPALETVILSDCVSVVEDFAFKKCKSLKELNFVTRKYREPITAEEKGKAFELMIAGKPAKIEYVEQTEYIPAFSLIGNCAFAGCESFDASKIKEKAKKVGICAFDNCLSEISNIVVDEGKEEIKNDEVSDSSTYIVDDDVYVDANDENENNELEEIIVIPTDDIDENNSEVIGEDCVPSEDVPLLENTFDEIKNSKCLINGFCVDEGDIVHIETQNIIPDVSIDVLDLSYSTYVAIRRHFLLLTYESKEVTVLDLLEMSREDLLKIKNIKQQSVEEIIEKVSAYLLADHTEKVIEETSQIDEIEEKVDEVIQDDIPKFLIEGFSIVDSNIISTESQSVIPDAEISVLNLSYRSYNAIYRNRSTIVDYGREEVMISDLLKMSFTDLTQIRNMGRKSTDEIVEKVTAYLYADHTGETYVAISPIVKVVAPNYKVIDGKITQINNGKVVSDTYIQYLGLSTRSVNSLRSKQITRLSELIGLSLQEVQAFPHMGIKSVNEIFTMIPEYLDSHQEAEMSSDELELENDISIKITLPPLCLDYPVLAPDYAVVNGVIYNRKTLKAIPDIPVEKMGLSVRSTNRLLGNGNRTLATLVGMPFHDFRNIRNLGLHSANEIQEKLEQYLENAHQNSSRRAVPVSTVTAMQVLDALLQHEFEYLDIYAIMKLLPDEAREEDTILVLAELVDAKKIIQDDDLYSIPHYTFFDTVRQLSVDNEYGLDARSVRVLQMRVSGMTLEEVGQSEDITRERIRQIESKAVRKLTRNEKVNYEEDKYAYLFSTYDLESDFYLEYLNESRAVIYYLNLRYTRGKINYKTAVDDEILSVSIRRAIDKYIHRGCIMVDGVYVPLLRVDIEDVVLERYCKDEVNLDEFFTYYESFLNEFEITDEKLQTTDSVRSSRSNRLSESNKVLWKQSRCLRYYDILGGDYTELLEVLNLGQYDNIELSTRKFLIDYPELMQQYDIRDEYELHNLLKKIHAEKENPQMMFGRMPIIQFGEFDRAKAVKEMLYAMAPISADNLAKMVSLEYGMREDVVRAGWFGCIAEYYHQGMFSIEYEDMPEEHIQLLKSELTEDFYYMSELRKIYGKLVADADMSLLSTYNLKKMGFIIGSTYVLQNHPTAEAYFDHLLTSNGIVDIAPFNKRYTVLSTYTLVLARNRHDLNIIEFEPYQHINISRLEKLGFGKDRLREYGSQVWSFLVDDEFFTIQSLKSDGFTSELDCLGFGDLFYASLLKEDDRFSWQKVGNAIVLNPKRTPFTVHDFLVYYINKNGSVNVDDFATELNERYGINLDRYTIIEKTRGGEIYYDSIMGKLYADYATYFEEI